MHTSALAVTLGLLLRASFPAEAEPATSRPASPADPAIEEASIQHDGLERWFIIVRPDGVRDGAPLVVFLHGGLENMRIINDRPASVEWVDVATEEGFVLIAPNGTTPGTGATDGRFQQWNSPSLTNEGSDVDDVGFILALLDWAADHHKIDLERVYVTGASNGGMMTYRLLIEEPDAFAAGAAFVANLPDPNPHAMPTRPTPLMIVNGTDDPMMPWNGGEVGSRGALGRVQSADETKAWWLNANRADPSHHTVHHLRNRAPFDGCRLVQEDFAPAEGGAPVRFITMDGGGHSIPSIRRSRGAERLIEGVFGNFCKDAEGARLTWDFFAQQKPREQLRSRLRKLEPGGE